MTAQALGGKPTSDEVFAQGRRQSAGENDAPLPRAPTKKVGGKKVRWALPLLLAAMFTLYHEFRRQHQPPSATEPVVSPQPVLSPPNTQSWRQSEPFQRKETEQQFDTQRIVGLLNKVQITSPAGAERSSNFVTFTLPRGVEVQISQRVVATWV